MNAQARANQNFESGSGRKMQNTMDEIPPRGNKRTRCTVIRALYHAGTYPPAGRVIESHGLRSGQQLEGLVHKSPVLMKLG